MHVKEKGTIHSTGKGRANEHLSLLETLYNPNMGIHHVIVSTDGCTQASIAMLKASMCRCIRYALHPVATGVLPSCFPQLRPGLVLHKASRQERRSMQL